MCDIRINMPFVQGPYSNSNKGVTVPHGADREVIIDALAGVMGGPHFAKAAKEQFRMTCNGQEIAGNTTLRDVGAGEGSTVTCLLALRGGGGPGVGKRGATDAGSSSSDKKPKRSAAHSFAQLNLVAQRVYGQDGSGRVGGLPDGPLSKAEFVACVQQWQVTFPTSAAFSNCKWPKRQRVGSDVVRLKEGELLIPTKMEEIAGIPRCPACSIATLCEEGVRSAAAKAPKGSDGRVAKDYDLVYAAIAQTVELAAKVGVKPQYFAENGESFLASLKSAATRHREAADEGASTNRFARAMADKPPAGVAEVVVTAAANAQAGTPLPSNAAAARSSVARHARGAACGRKLREGATEEEKERRHGWLLSQPHTFVSRALGEDGQRKYDTWLLLNPGLPRPRTLLCRRREPARARPHESRAMPAAVQLRS